MFENANNINWDILKTAHGTASHIPDALHNLISEDKAIRRSAYWKIDNYVVLQGDLYEAAWYVIPFLLEILKSPIIFGRKETCNLLFEIGNGYAPPDHLIKLPNGNLESLTSACRKSVLEGVDIYLSEMHNTHSPARLTALQLVASLKEMHSETINILRELYRQEQDDAFRRELQEYLEEMQ